VLLEFIGFVGLKKRVRGVKGPRVRVKGQKTREFPGFCFSLDVRCWTLDVRCSLGSKGQGFKR
jgi:hypothetical protein